MIKRKIVFIFLITSCLGCMSQTNTIRLRYKLDTKYKNLKGWSISLKSSGGYNQCAFSRDSVLSITPPKKEFLDVVIKIGRKNYSFNNIHSDKLNGIWELWIDKRPFDVDNLVLADKTKKIKAIYVINFGNNDGDNTNVIRVIYKR